MGNGNYDTDLRVVEMVQDMKNKIEGAQSVPLTGKVMVDREELLEYLNDITAILPTEYKHVLWISDQKKKIMEESNLRSKEIIENAQNEEMRILESAKEKEYNILLNAEERARHLTNNHTIVKNAEKMANELIISAKENAAIMRTNSYDYVEDMMNKLKSDVEGTLGIIDENINELKNYKV